MRSRYWLIAVGLAVLVGLAVAALRLLDHPRARAKPLSDLEVAGAWLQCIDCKGPFLKRLADMPASNRDTVTQFLRSALLNGPDSTQRIRQEQDLMRTWRADSLRRARRGQPVRPDSQRVEFMERYRRGFEVKWRGRAATALGVIRNAVAMATLTNALHFPVNNLGDSTIRVMVQRAIADSGRAVDHYP